MKKLRVLVVDDSELFRTSVIKIIQPYAAQIDEAKEGFETFLMVHKAMEKNEPYDLILLDLNMPQFRGEEFIKKVKESAALHNLQDVPKIIILSSELSKAKMVELISAGCQDYLKKPFQPEELISKVKESFKDLDS
ncbi:MAG: response regulator [Planctomycetes bacterium]|nr:response regulator [Planctomycetota bacterium]